jgi:hypothetical protein
MEFYPSKYSSNNNRLPQKLKNKNQNKSLIMMTTNFQLCVPFLFVTLNELKDARNGVIVISFWLSVFQEERRAALEKYSYTKEKIEAQVSRLDQTIESRITSIGGLSSINFLE